MFSVQVKRRLRDRIRIAAAGEKSGICFGHSGQRRPWCVTVSTNQAISPRITAIYGPMSRARPRVRSIMPGKSLYGALPRGGARLKAAGRWRHGRRAERGQKVRLSGTVEARVVPVVQVDVLASRHGSPERDISCQGLT